MLSQDGLVRHMVLAHGPSCSMLGVSVCWFGSGVWVVDTPAPQGVGCVRFASGGGRLVSVDMWCPTLRALVVGVCQFLVLVCAGCASLNPRGGLRLVPHGGGVGVCPFRGVGCWLSGWLWVEGAHPSRRHGG